MHNAGNDCWRSVRVDLSSMAQELSGTEGKVPDSTGNKQDKLGAPIHRLIFVAN
jgi:hypothetical protein